MTNAELALHYAQQGWAVFPLQHASKRPLRDSNGHKDATRDPDQIATWWHEHRNANIGIACGDQSDLVVVDIDVGPGKSGLESIGRLMSDLKLPDTRLVRTGRGGLHLYFSDSKGISCSAAGLKEKYPSVDIRSNGGYVVAPGSTHENGKKYEWVDDTAPIVPLPEGLRALLTRRRPETVPAKASTFATRIAEGGRNVTLTSFAGRLRKQGCDAETIEAALWVKNQKECDPPLSVEEVRTIAKSVARYEPQPNVRFTELWASERAAELFGENLRYQADAKQWLVWDNKRWKPDGSSQVTHLVSQLGAQLRDEADRISDEEYAAGLRKFAGSLETRTRIKGVVELLAVNPNMQVNVADLDCDGHLLNFRNGTLDLRENKFRAHERSALITKIIDLDYDQAIACPRFDQFLKEVFATDPEVIDYLQRYFGYCLTGDTSDQSLLLLMGSGANGKSVLANVICKSLGDYAGNASPETFAVREGGGTRGDLTRLRGARAVFTSESNEDTKIDEAMIKRLTGGEPIVARALYQAEQEFTPGFKVIFGTNNLPRLTADDAAIWRRLRVVPFRRVFREDERDEELTNKLLAEKAGILNWMIQGHVEYRSRGLVSPASVRDAVTEHRTNLDSIGTFLEASCDVGLIYATRASDIFRAFSNWAISEGIPSVSQTRLGTALSRKGFTRRKTHGNVMWHGVGLRNQKP